MLWRFAFIYQIHAHIYRRGGAQNVYRKKFNGAARAKESFCIILALSRGVTRCNRLSRGNLTGTTRSHIARKILPHHSVGKVAASTYNAAWVADIFPIILPAATGTGGSYIVQAYKL